MEIQPDSLSRREAHKLMISLITPRPIAWVTTISPEGVVNAAPFSFFNGVCSKPPTIMVSVGPGRHIEKDTIRNIKSTGEFVVNLVSEEHAEAMNITATEYPYGISEIDEAGLDTEPSSMVAVPRIKGSPASMECTLQELIPIGDPPTALVLGSVLAFHLRDDIPWNRDTGLEPSDTGVIGRLGQDRYVKISDIFEMDRIRYKPTDSE